MAYSSGFKTLIGQVLSWAAVGGLAAAVFSNYDQLKTFFANAPGAGPSAGVAIQSNAPLSQERIDSTGSSVSLRAGENGHYHTRADVNGRSIHAMVDTGASMVVLTYEDARAAGIHLTPSDFVQTASTANGTARFAPVTLDRVSIGSITVRNVRAAVADRGRLAVTLLGMSFLSSLERVDMRDGVMVLKD